MPKRELVHHARRSAKPDYSQVNPLWKAAFCGLFAGEGYINIARRQKKGRWYYSPELTINLRYDEKPMLDDVQQHLGGRVNLYANRTKNTNSCDQVRWTITGYAPVQAVLEFLVTTPLLARKTQEAHLVLDFIAWRLTQGCFLGETAVISEDYCLRLRSSRHLDCKSAFNYDSVISAEFS